MFSILSALVILLSSNAYGQYQDGDVRLVGGSYQWEGRVEVYMSGVWGTITDSDWTNDDATVVCRKLGHFRPGATAHSNAYFGDGKGPVNLDSVICSGSEYILTDCELQNSGLTTSHSLDVGVKCQPAYGSYREGDIRLVGGPHNWEGRVEIFWNGEWGTISDSSWTTSDARVVCRQLQHASGSGVAVRCCNEYGKGEDNIQIHTVTCGGFESNITQCGYINVTTPTSHNQDVGVQCQQGGSFREGEIRLNRTYGTTGLWTGRVEIYLFGEWGTICDDSSYGNDAQVVCRQLGYYTYGSNYGCCSRFGQGSGPIHFRGLGCSGIEHRLSDCQNLTYGCSHYEDWSVYCQIDGPEERDFSLSSTDDGYVQVFTSNIWRYVAETSYSWSMNNGEVLCTQLGYNSSGTEVISSYTSVSFNYKTIDNVVCSGTETRIADCAYDFHVVSTFSQLISRTECNQYDCVRGGIRLVGGDSEREGRVEVCINKNWGTVCDKGWTLNNTLVVCRYLGFSDDQNDLAHYSSERYGEGVGPVLTDYVNCSGAEDDLLDDCYSLTHYFGCSHENDVGVSCKPAQCVDGQLRLAGTTRDYYGRVEICSNKRWNTLSDSNWIQNNADVTCLDLGFQDSSSAFSYYGYGGGPRYSKYFRCTGRESRLVSCNTFEETYTKSQSSDIGVSCTQAYCSDGELRLTEGQNEWEGRLEVCYNRRWGTVGGDGWTETNSHVVCNALGYDITDERANQSIPNAPSKPLYYHSIRCSRRDLLLLECGFKRYTDKTQTYPEAVVRCKKPICEEGELRLSGGSTERDGRVEICIKQRWGTIDGDGWTHTDTEVACEILGLSKNDVSYTKGEREGYGYSQSLPVHMTLVGCYGSENNLTECSYHEYEYTSNAPSISKDVRITCSAGDADSTSAQLSAVANTALSMSVILAIAVVIIVAILILVIVFQRKRKTTTRDITSEQDPVGGTRYTPGIQYNKKDQNISFDNKLMAEDIPQDSYEEVEAPNALPVPPKPQPKKQNKPKPKSTSTCYEPGKENTKPSSGGGGAKRPAVPAHAGHQPHTQPRAQQPRAQQPRAQQPHHAQQHAQQQTWQPRPPSPEAIYECPD